MCAASDGFSSASSPLAGQHFLPGVVLGEFSPRNGFWAGARVTDPGVRVTDRRAGCTSGQQDHRLL